MTRSLPDSQRQIKSCIENVRLFDEIHDKSQQLEVASQHKSQFVSAGKIPFPGNGDWGSQRRGSIDQPAQMLAIALTPFEHAKHLLGWVAVSTIRHQFGIAQDGIERRAQLVRRKGG